jgi:MFS family permease
MGRRAAAWLAWSLVGLSGALLVGGIAYGSTVDAIFTLAPLLTFSVVGAIIASRHPRNAIGWLFCGIGLVVGLSSLTGGYAEYWLENKTGSKSIAETAAWFSSWGWILLVFPTSFILLLFPDGRLPSPRWRSVAWCAGLGILGFVVSYATDAGPLEEFPQIVNPYGFDSPVLGVVGVAGALVAGGSMVASAISLIVRMRRAGSEQRQQIKWLSYGGAVVVGTIFVGGVISIWSGPISIAIIGVALLGVPVFTGIAIVRHRLYDIDVVINFTLVYAILSATLAVVYFGSIVLLQRVFAGLTGQEKLPQLAIVASTLVIAALFNPLRRRIQSFIDRRFYRRKYDARQTLETFSAKLRDETDLGTLSEDLVGVVRETMQPAHLSLWLRPETASRDRQAN